MLKGKLVLLRPVQRSDITYFVQWFNDHEVTQYSKKDNLPRTEMAIQKFIEDLGTTRSSTDAHFIIETNNEEPNKAIGDVSLSRINGKDRSATFGISIGDKQYWSKGYGSEATQLIIRYGFEQLNLHRISSGVWSFNERSIRLHMKLGFIEEGRRLDAVFKNGAYYDEVVFGLLADEWKKSK